MLVRICDCCGKEMKKDYINFRIQWNLADVPTGKTEDKATTTRYLECCEKCFSDVLQRLGLEKE